MPAVDEIELNHRLPLMRVAFDAGLHTGLAANAAIGIDEELVFGRDGHYLFFS
jgi:hypothetical protein